MIETIFDQTIRNFGFELGIQGSHDSMGLASVNYTPEDGTIRYRQYFESDLIEPSDAWRLHRTDGPAEIMSGGDCCWYHTGAWHREGGPAIEPRTGFAEWREKGRRILTVSPNNARLQLCSDRAVHIMIDQGDISTVEQCLYGLYADAPLELFCLRADLYFGRIYDECVPPLPWLGVPTSDIRECLEEAKIAYWD